MKEIFCSGNMEVGSMIVNSTITNEDSGYENGSLSDSSNSSSNLDFYKKKCVFATQNKAKANFNHPNHKCAVYCYNLSGYHIQTLSQRTFHYLSNCVRKLNLSNNQIYDLPESIGLLKCLEELNLAHNSLKHLPKSLDVLHKLKVLELANNFFSEVPVCLTSGMEQLTHIDLSYNNISDFANQPMCLPILQCLNLSHNKFNSLPLWLFSEQCRSLVELNMSFNFCLDDTSLNSNLLLLKHHRTSSLKTLRKLIITNIGARKDVIKILCQFEKLQSLCMGNLSGPENQFNYFCEIPMCIFSNPLSVVELHLAGVGLAGIPEEIYRLGNLKVLDFSNNTLDWLPDNFGQLANLEELILSNCNLAYLPKSFGHLTTLKKLVLYHNQLIDVHSQLEGLINLDWLDLYDNCLEQFPLSYDHMLNLHKMDVAANHFDLKFALNSEVQGDSLQVLYNQLQANLRETDSKYHERINDSKAHSNISSWDSCESLHRRKYSEEESDADIDTQLVSSYFQGEKCIGVDEEENWDTDSTCEDDNNFDPNTVYRYFLPPGEYQFGWRPPISVRECIVPTTQILSGFVYIPGQAHVKTTRRFRMNLMVEPSVIGQFDDAKVDDSDGAKEKDNLLDFLKSLCVFVLYPHCPRVLRCKICSIYDNCWHFGKWMKF